MRQGTDSVFRVFVAGTDTGVGKTEAACALLSLLADMHCQPAAFKPYESGCDKVDFPRDALALREAARSTDNLNHVCPHRFSAPLAPYMAARLMKKRPSIRATTRAFATFAGRCLVVEGAGGIFVPIDSKHDVIDLIRLLGLPVLLVARAGLGTINHTALSLEALRRRHIETSAVILVRHCQNEDISVNTNAHIISTRYRIRVLGPVGYYTNSNERRLAYREVIRPWLTHMLTQ